MHDPANAGGSVEAASRPARRRSSHATRDIAVVGASAGGLRALQRLAAGLPPGYRGAIFIAMHTSPEARSELAAILGRAGTLPVTLAADGAAIEPGHLYVAPADHHLLVERGRMLVVRGPRENRHRPAIDPLFRSAAWAYGPRAVGVVLTGDLDDWTAGLWAIKSCGGTTVVQEPDDADHPQMPFNALMHNDVDHRLPLADIAGLLYRLAREPIDVPRPAEPPNSLHDEVEFARMNRGIRAASALGRLSSFTCPSCRGALWELEEGGHLRYRCHTGHAYSQSSLLVDQTIAIEESLYTALRAVEEKAAVLRRLAERWPDRLPDVRRDYEERARELDRSADALRTLLTAAPS